jgi:hypothetical protein
MDGRPIIFCPSGYFFGIGWIGIDSHYDHGPFSFPIAEGGLVTIDPTRRTVD